MQRGASQRQEKISKLGWNKPPFSSVLVSEPSSRLGGLMEMRWKNDVLIEDLRNHSSDVVESLREVLADGACMVPDAKRPGFYEIESDTHVYYVHIHETTGKVMLLATWPSPRVLDEVHQLA
jgi:hypothetical protein